MTEPNDALEILAYLAEQDMCDVVFWRCDGEYAPISIFVNCNDLFWWATSDAEELTIKNLPVLKQAVVDCEEIDSKMGVLAGPALFCCRVRGMRPQQPAYPKDEKWRALFDACGPERDPKDEG